MTPLRLTPLLLCLPTTLMAAPATRDDALKLPDVLISANRNRLGGYGLVGLRGSWEATPDVSVALKLDNLLDKGYSRALYSFDGDSQAYREEGRTWLLSLTWTPTL